MTNYISQYEDYYKSYLGEANLSQNIYSPSIKGKEEHNRSFFGRRIVVDLIGVLVLMIFVILCKTINTPYTKSAYTYSKNVLNQSYDYTQITDYFKNFSYKEFQDNLGNWMEDTKSNIDNKLKSTSFQQL